MTIHESDLHDTDTSGVVGQALDVATLCSTTSGASFPRTEESEEVAAIEPVFSG